MGKRRSHQKTLVDRVLVAEDEEQMGHIAARAIVDDIEEAMAERGRAVVLFASAPSQRSTWRAMLKFASRKAALGALDLNRIFAFHMDEYLGFEPGSRQSLGRALGELLLQPLGLRQENVCYFDIGVGYTEAVELRNAIFRNESEEVIESLTTALEASVRHHVEDISSGFARLGGVFDVVVGGIGKHPHIAFNDFPYADFRDEKVVKVVRLSEESREQQVDDNVFARKTDVPTHALTFTLPPIFGARSIHIVVPGAHKAEAVRSTLDGPVTERVPASGLRLLEVLPKVKFYLDKSSAALSEVARGAIRKRGYLKFRVLETPEVSSLLSDVSEVRETAIANVPLPAGQRILVVDEKEVEAYLGPLLSSLARRNEIVFLDDLGSIERAVKYAPDVLVVLYREVPTAEWEGRAGPLLKALSKVDAKIVYYFTPESYRDNVYFFFGEREMSLKRRAMGAHRSQLGRVEYDVATRYMNMAYAIYGGLSGMGRGKYAEPFKKVSIRGGEVEEVVGSALLSDEDISERSTAVLISPHPDDVEFSCSASVSLLKRRGCYVVNLVYTSGARAHVPEVDDVASLSEEEKKRRKVELRRREIEAAARVLNIDEYHFLSLDFYDSESGDRISQRDFEEVDRLFNQFLDRHVAERGGSFLVFVPRAEDLHPNHRASNLLTLEILRKVSKARRFLFSVYFYKTAWTGTPNLFYFFPRFDFRGGMRSRATAYEARALAIVGAEVLRGFARTPPKPRELGGEFAIRLLVK